MSDEHSCPNCKTNEAVPKSVAWDALATVPPKAARELKRLRNIELAARSLIEAGPHPGDAETVVTTIPVAFLDSLAMTFGMPGFPTMLETWRGSDHTLIPGGTIPASELKTAPPLTALITQAIELKAGDTRFFLENDGAGWTAGIGGRSEAVGIGETGGEVMTGEHDTPEAALIELHKRIIDWNACRLSAENIMVSTAGSASIARASEQSALTSQSWSQTSRTE